MAKNKRTNGHPTAIAPATENGQTSRFKRIVAEERSRDPATGVNGAAPNFSRQMLPHIMTFMSQTSTWNQIYRNPDEALRHSRDNARHMRNDPSIMECLEARQRATALLGYHLEPEDSKCPKQKQLVTDLTGIIERTPDFTEYRRNLLEALWYGRYANQQVWGHTFVRGVRSVAVVDWTPVLGDKLVFRFDTGSGKYSRRDVGIRVGGYHSKRDAIAGDRKLEPTEWGMAYFLEEWERPMLAVHKHIIEDGAYEDSLSAGRIHGVGIRDRIYWCWFQKQETMAHLMEVIERTGTGFTIYYYQYGNDESFTKMKEVAEKQTKNNVILIPRMSGDPAMDAHGIDRIEPSSVGIDALKSIIHEFFGHQIKRYILGQVLSSEAAATGLGSGVADLHQDTFSGIIQYDAVKLEETLTHQLVKHIIEFNPRFNWARNIYIRFKIDTKSVDAEEKLTAAKMAWDMGLRIKATDVMDLIGFSTPGEDDEVLQNPAMQPQLPGMGMGGAPGEMPGQQGPPAEPGSNEDLFGPIMGALGGDESQGGDNIGDGPPPGGPGGDFSGGGAPPGPMGGQQRYQRLRDEVQRAAEETDSNPSDEQKEAGNYRKGKVTIHGLPVTIENAKGSKRRQEWKPLAHHYGYINRTEGKDGDHVDVFIGPEPETELVYVIDQCREDGSFDEHKCMIGFPTCDKAKEGYLANYQDGWKCGPITAMTVEQFKAWLEDGDTTMPVEEQVSRYAARKPLRSSPGQMSLIPRETTTGDHSRWREELHPRGAGGKFTDKGHAIVPSSPGQKTLDLSEVDQHKAEIEVHKADLELASKAASGQLKSHGMDLQKLAGEVASGRLSRNALRKTHGDEAYFAVKKLLDEQRRDADASVERPSPEQVAEDERLAEEAASRDREERDWQDDQDRIATEERDQKAREEESRRRDPQAVAKWLVQDADEAQRTLARDGLSRQDRRDAHAAIQLAQSHAALINAGWQFEYMSRSGSLYYTKGERKLRVADHEVPLTGEREHNVKHGGFSWAENADQIILPVDDVEEAVANA